MPDGMVRRWTFPSEWSWVLSLLLLGSFFVPTHTVGWHAAQIALQSATIIGVMVWIVSLVQGAAHPWVTAVLSILAVGLLYLGRNIVYSHWQNDQVQQSVN